MSFARLGIIALVIWDITVTRSVCVTVAPTALLGQQLALRVWLVHLAMTGHRLPPSVWLAPLVEMVLAPAQPAFLAPSVPQPLWDRPRAPTRVQWGRGVQ